MQSMKWTDGQPYERTRRLRDQIVLENAHFNQSMTQSAHSLALHHDESTWSMLNMDGFTVSNKREDMGQKLATRQMVQQTGSNPFFVQNNYVTDVSVQNAFLKPINTSNQPNHG